MVCALRRVLEQAYRLKLMNVEDYEYGGCFCGWGFVVVSQKEGNVPELNQLQGWLRSGGRLTEIPQMEGWRSPLLEVSFSTSEQELQVFAPTGEVFRTYEDVVQERDRQQQRADGAELERDRATERAESAESDLQQLREKLRQLNIDPDSL